MSRHTEKPTLPTQDDSHWAAVRGRDGISGKEPAAAQHGKRVARLCRLIEAEDSPPSLATLAEHAQMIPSHLHRLFKALTGLTPRAYAMAQRSRKVREALDSEPRVTNAIHAAGYSSSGRFTCRRRAGRWRQRVRAAGRPGGRPGRAPRLGLDLPLDIRGTAFPQRSWQALWEGTPGSTASYADIARRIGSPKAARAVDGACAANALAVATPCHRVVRLDGTLSGYRWGVERKRALLEREAQP